MTDSRIVPSDDSTTSNQKPTSHESLSTSAKVWGITYSDTLAHDIAPRSFGISAVTIIEQWWMPIERRRDGSVSVAITRRPDPDMLASIEEALGATVRPVLVTPDTFSRALLTHYGPELADRAAFELSRSQPERSAKSVLVAWQKVVLGVVLAAVLGVAIAAPRETFIALTLFVGVSFLIGTGFKFWASMRGARLEGAVRVSAADLAELRDEALPRYTVLVPVYKESNIVAQLMGNLGALDYPSDKLEILILVEEDDAETRNAIAASVPPDHFRVVVVPDVGPRTKPKACNVGLQLATGDLLVIYDAEDRPDPDQLKKAVVAFERGGPGLVCVQGALNYFNPDQNVLTRMFTLEYSFWFDYMLPGLEFGRLAIPLGGTSNHFRVDGLRSLGGWDPFNVTEDADLGIRAAAVGLDVAVFDSTTFEEANSSVPNFVRQRSRWIKGYMQTTLVHLRNPFQLLRIAGWRKTLSFLFLVGGTPATFLAVPILYTVFFLSLVSSRDTVAFLFPGWVLWVNLFNLGVGSAMMIYVSMMGAFKRRRYSLVAWGMLNPFYWLLHSIAAYKALWQLIGKPHYWEKTVHGLSSATAE